MTLFCRHWYFAAGFPDVNADDVAVLSHQAARAKAIRGFGRHVGLSQQGYSKSLKWVLNRTRLVGAVLQHHCAEYLAISRSRNLLPSRTRRTDGRDTG